MNDLFDPSPVSLGQEVAVTEYYYTNEHGGTGGPVPRAVVKVVRSWWDYETGWRFWGLLGAQLVYFSEFDIENIAGLGRKEGDADELLRDFLESTLEGEAEEVLLLAENIAQFAQSLLPEPQQEIVRGLTRRTSVLGVSRSLQSKNETSAMISVAYSLMDKSGREKLIRMLSRES